ncbi:MAG: helicase-related protein [Campylobacterota bacterium]|nr:helicase-related protein [Campylobacterota bacterium]
MSSKFFTNRDSNTLENRLKDILLHHKNSSHLEFLIGYFRISGFSKIASLMNNITNGRILVGINIDAMTQEALERGKKLNLLDFEKMGEQFKKEQILSLNSESYGKRVDDSVNILAQMISDKKIEIRISPNKEIHSKIYILREEEIERHDGEVEHRGSVITGSSNLSENGLSKNFEFNVELRDSDDIAFALEEFENLWAGSVEITDNDIDNIKQNSHLKDVTPYELYLKFLIEHFDDRIDYDPNLIWNLPNGFMKLAYQFDAVTEGLSKIKKHNGFFLSDVVGLGKTVTTAMIVKKLLFDIKGEVLVIAPPSIQKEWKETFEKFEVGTLRHYDIKSLGKLESIRDTQRYELVIIDESHKFKNYATSRYVELERICKERVKYKKKVILISATPLNNRPMDIANQLYLFQDKRNSTIDSFLNLESFFAQIDKSYKEIIKPSKDNKPIDLVKLKELSLKVRESILREVMVRRTRTDIQTHPMYADDIKEQGLKVPDVAPIEEVAYEMSDSLVKTFDETIEILTNKLQYDRYKILAYIKVESRKKYGNISENIFEKGALELANLMRNMLVKRFESSFYAFKSTLSKQENNLKSLIEMFKNDKILLGSKINIFEILDDEENGENKIDEMLQSGKVVEFTTDDFHTGYKEKLEKELIILQNLNKMWVDVKEDPKLDKFKEVLQNHKDSKMVVFTESKQTALYLEENLKEFKILCVHGGNRDKLKDTIRENFDANYELKKQKNEFNVIITTDTLSEGVNMHRSNIIYNYDIPWNSTRLMQRIGRINRIGTKHDKIYVNNFVPSAGSDTLIELSKKAFVKLQTFHSTFGEDNQIYSKNEEVESVTLFEELSEDLDEELSFLEEIREYKNANPKKFKALKKLPAKIRVQRDDSVIKNATFVFIKNENSKSYYFVQDEVSEPINFIEMAKQLKVSSRAKGITPLKELHYEQIESAMQSYTDELSKIIQDVSRTKVENPTDKKAINLLKGWRKKSVLDKELVKIFISIIEDGRIQNMGRKIKALEKKSAVEVVNAMELLQDEYSLEQLEDKVKRIKRDAQVILSETFLGK